MQAQDPRLAEQVRAIDAHSGKNSAVPRFKEFLHACPDVRRAQYEDGVYIGQFKGALRQGWGLMYFTNSDLYFGEWINDWIQGFGFYFFFNGECYKGQFQEGNKHGRGEYLYSNGNVYEGEWQEGVKQGRGRMYNLELAYEYVGDFYLNCKHGKGFEKVSEGQYIGPFKNGKKHGQVPLKPRIKRAALRRTRILLQPPKNPQRKAPALQINTR